MSYAIGQIHSTQLSAVPLDDEPQRAQHAAGLRLRGPARVVEELQRRVLRRAALGAVQGQRLVGDRERKRILVAHTPGNLNPKTLFNSFSVTLLFDLIQ